MRTLALIAALAACAAANAAGIRPVAPASVVPDVLSPRVQATTAAAPDAPLLPEAAAAEYSFAPEDIGVVAEASAVGSAAPEDPGVLAETSAVGSAAPEDPGVLAEASAVGSAAPGEVSVLPEAGSGSFSNLAEAFVRFRPLSGPWSAVRRLEAARSFGDETEAARMEAKLRDLLLEACAPEEEAEDD